MARGRKDCGLRPPSGPSTLGSAGGGHRHPKDPAPPPHGLGVGAWVLGPQLLPSKFTGFASWAGVGWGGGGRGAWVRSSPLLKGPTVHCCKGRALPGHSDPGEPFAACYPERGLEGPWDRVGGGGGVSGCHLRLQWRLRVAVVTGLNTSLLFGKCGPERLCEMLQDGGEGGSCPGPPSAVTAASVSVRPSPARLADWPPTPEEQREGWGGAGATEPHNLGPGAGQGPETAPAPKRSCHRAGGRAAEQGGAPNLGSTFGPQSKKTAPSFPTDERCERPHQREEPTARTREREGVTGVGERDQVLGAPPPRGATRRRGQGPLSRGGGSSEGDPRPSVPPPPARKCHRAHGHSPNLGTAQTPTLRAWTGNKEKARQHGDPPSRKRGPEAATPAIALTGQPHKKCKLGAETEPAAGHGGGGSGWGAQGPRTLRGWSCACSPDGGATSQPSTWVKTQRVAHVTRVPFMSNETLKNTHQSPQTSGHWTYRQQGL